MLNHRFDTAYGTGVGPQLEEILEEGDFFCRHFKFQDEISLKSRNFQKRQNVVYKS